MCLLTPITHLYALKLQQGKCIRKKKSITGENTLHVLITGHSVEIVLGAFCQRCSLINYIPMKLHCIQQYQYPGNFISKDRQLKPNRGQWNTKQRESHWIKHLKAREWETREGKEKDSDYISPVNDTLQEHYCACVYVCVCLSPRVYRTVCVQSEHVCTCARVLCVCVRAPVCYAWRHTCSNRVVVDSDSCPVPFTAQSSQPPLCSVRLLMRINVLWRPLGLPQTPPLHPPPQQHS